MLNRRDMILRTASLAVIPGLNSVIAPMEVSQVPIMKPAIPSQLQDALFARKEVTLRWQGSTRSFQLLQNIVEKCGGTGVLSEQQLDEEKYFPVIIQANILENQRLFGQKLSDFSVTNYNGEKVEINRILIATTRQSYGYFNLNQLFNVWPMHGPTETIFWQDSKTKQFSTTEICAKTRKLKTTYHNAEDLRPNQDLSHIPELAYPEYQYRRYLQAEEINIELFRLAVTNVQKLASKTKCFKHRIKAMIKHQSKIMELETGAKPTYILTSPDVISTLDRNLMRNFYEFSMNLGPQKIGQWEGLDIWQDPLYPANKLFMGHKSNPWSGGYTIAPYLPLQLTPITFDPPLRCYLTKFGECMKPEGKKLYHVIELV